ncbi:MAG: HlyD family efflux transporter periplasmic adaptor subunit [Clostridiales bacterium]|nr:HlyD family efflux transporter periplasmic adaptor subunit [Clostridiales bacterium]
MWNKKAVIIVGFIAVIGMTGVGIYLGTRESEAEVVTKETTVEYGNLTVGVTESGTAALGTVEQKFSVDLSENGNSGTTTSSQNTNDLSGIQGMNMTAGNNGGSSNQSNSNSSSESGILEVEEIYVSEGQVVEKGDNLLKLTKESIDKSREILKNVVDSAELTLKKAKIDRKSTKVSAKYEYEENITIGKNAKNDYNNTISSLQNAVNEAQDAVEEADKRIAAIPKEIKKLQAQKTSASKATSTKNTGMPSDMGTGDGTQEVQGNKNIESSTTDNSTTTGATDTTSGVDSQISALETELSSLKKNYSNLVNRLTQAKSEQISGKITAKEKYDQAILNYENAKEIYDIAMNGIDDEVNEAKDALADAKENLAEFESFVLDGIITTEYAGTILSIGYEKGDTLNSDTAIAAYADAKAVEVTVSVSQEDISNVEIGETVNIAFTAYEEEMYHGIVTGITTSESSSSSTVSYDVTINVTGDVAKIYEGMTANVTFVTKELKDVVYVSNKAIQTEGTKSYVKRVKDGKTEKLEVETGFSNGTDVEIKNGLSQGDTVLIESQAGGS